RETGFRTGCLLAKRLVHKKNSTENALQSGDFLLHNGRIPIEGGHSRMNEEERKDIALFRYQLIAPLLRLTGRGQIQPALVTLAKEEHTLPNGSVRRYSVRTLERYLAQYRKGGFDALLPEE